MRKLLLIITLLSVSIFGQGIKISQLPSTTTLGNSDMLLIVVDSSGTKITKNILASYFSTQLAGKLTTSNLSEGSNLYYTDARAITALTGNNNTWSGSNKFNGAITDNGVSIDTIASRGWVYSTFPTITTLTGNNNNWTGINAFNGNTIFDGLVLLPYSVGTIWGNIGYAGTNGTSYIQFNYGTSLTDTLASQRWVRANYPTSTNFVSLTASQSISGNKTFTGAVVYNPYTGDTDIQTTGYTLPVPTTNIMPCNASVANTTVIGMAAGYNGQVVYITNPAGFTTTLINNDPGGNFKLNQNFSLKQGSILTVMYISFLSKWCEVSRSDNG